jgi:two-component system phosphate regulon sensor histidine kinase PhoR
VTKKIFRSILFSSLIAVILGLLMATFFTYKHFGSVQEQKLRGELRLAATAVEECGEEYLQKLEVDGLRLTLINPDGKVLYDSKVEAESMENHAERKEVKEALLYGEGSSSRYSTTRLDKTIYHAIKLKNGEILRVSVSYSTVSAVVQGLLPLFLLAALIVALVALVVAKSMAKSIVAPLDEVDLEHPLENDTYEELSPFLLRLHRLNERVEEQLVKLRQSADEFNHISENMREGLVLLNDKKELLSINPSAMKVFGVEENPKGENFLQVDRSLDLNAALDEAYETGYSALKEVRNGKSLRFDLSRIESEGETLGLLILIIDVSERELAEQSRREFSANVSHELKTPLTSIIASAELMRNKLVKPEDSERFLWYIEEEGRRLLELIEDIIELSKLDEGRNLPKENFELSELVKDAAEQLRDSAEERDIRLELELEPCIIEGVPGLAQEIAANLIENAIKYNIEGGSVNVSLKSENEKAVLKISDTGIGISAEDKDRVFERFYRVDKSHSKKTEGTGLGLSIVKHAAACLNAEVRLESELGKGTEITILFPKKK